MVIPDSEILKGNNYFITGRFLNWESRPDTSGRLLSLLSVEKIWVVKLI